MIRVRAVSIGAGDAIADGESIACGEELGGPTDSTVLEDSCRNACGSLSGAARTAGAATTSGAAATAGIAIASIARTTVGTSGRGNRSAKSRAIEAQLWCVAVASKS